MDGAGFDTFKRGWTPYIESLIEKGYCLNLHEDLLSRGWVEIFTGKHAIETGALYDRPIANRTLDWTEKFSMENIPGWGERIKPIWQVLNERGYKVGIMNIPTTFPAPKVDGFFVSGGGGGAKVVDDVTEDLCYPKDIAKYLQRIGYIVDQRMPDLFKKNILTADEVFERFQIKNQKRTESFIKLSKEKDIDFGFVVYKTSSVMAEFFTIPELEKQSNGDRDFDSNLLEISKKYYQDFDKQIKHLVESFDNPEVILVSDHSEINTSHEVNLNLFLKENYFQTKKELSSSLFTQYLKNYVKQNVSPVLWERIKNVKKVIPDKNNKKLHYDRCFQFNAKKSVAFCVSCGDWCRGIYINDDERFSGIVSQGDIVKLAHEISEKINNNSVSKKHNISSHVKSVFDTYVSKYYPDVVVNIPEGYLISRDDTKSYITTFKGISAKSKNNNTISAWAKTNGISLTVRGYRPLAVSTCPWRVNASISDDLTVLYWHVFNKFESKF